MAKKIGIKSAHTNGARPLGTPRPSTKKNGRTAKPNGKVMHTPDFSTGDTTVEPVAGVIVTLDENSPCVFPKVDVASDSEVAVTPPNTAMTPTTSKGTTMNLTLKGLNKKGTSAIYTGLNSTVRVGLAAFPNKTAPQTLNVDGEFAPARTPRAKETKEERRARLAALPKPTAAQKLQKLEARAARLREKLAKESAAA